MNERVTDEELIRNLMFVIESEINEVLKRAGNLHGATLPEVAVKYQIDGDNVSVFVDFVNVPEYGFPELDIELMKLLSWAREYAQARLEEFSESA